MYFNMYAPTYNPNIYKKRNSNVNMNDYSFTSQSNTNANKNKNNIYISGALMASLFKNFHIYGNNTFSK